MNHVRLLGALATAMVVTAGPAFAQSPPSAAAAAAPAAAQAPATGGRASAFLKVDGPQGMIQGESADKGHSGWIELSSFQWGIGRGMQTGGGAGAGTGGGTGKVALSDIVITKKTDKSSPTLQLAFANGTHFKNAVVELVKPSSDGHGVVYYRATMSDVYVSADRVGTGGGGSGVPTESVTLNFSKIAFEYTQQKADGSPGSYAPVQEGYDVKTNIKL
jgi:type VI secretion system secreted protein Hcp